MPISRSSKEAIKVAGALTIVYGVALGLDWDKPYWAGFAVVVCSQINLGQSINRVIMRIGGTIVAALVSWTIFGIFPQDRWLFMIALSSWVGICVYFLQESKFEYFWTVGAFVTVVLWDATGGDFSLTFEKGILRIQETLLGVVVYSLIAVLIWPNRSRPELDKASIKLAEQQCEFNSHCFSKLYDRYKNKDLSQQRLDLIQADAQLRSAIDDASVDSYEIWESRRQWRHYGNRSTVVTQALLKFEESLVIAKRLYIPDFFPNIKNISRELGVWFTQICTFFTQNKKIEFPGSSKGHTIEENINKIKSLSTFEAAALSVTYQRLKKLEIETRFLGRSIEDISELGSSYLKYPYENKSNWLSFFMPTPDRIATVIRVISGIWIAYLAYIYIPDLINGMLVVTLAGVMGSMLASKPMSNLVIICQTTVLVCVIATPLYIFLLPKLASYYTLGPILFLWFFYTCYFSDLFFKGQVLVKLMALFYFQIVFNLANHQEYNFINILDLALTGIIVFSILGVVKNIPFSLIPENKFRQIVRRFFSSAGYLLSGKNFTPVSRFNFFRRVMIEYHVNVVLKTREALKYWVNGIDVKDTNSMTEEQLRRIVKLVILLSNQVNTFYELDRSKGPLIASNKITNEVMQWRALTSQAMLDLSSSKPDLDTKHLREQYAKLFKSETFSTDKLFFNAKDDPGEHGKIIKFLYFLGITQYINIFLLEVLELFEEINWDEFCQPRFFTLREAAR
ncbi:FUSC family protein [Microbulbifer discodermiae]|uniref:FUSC family protein n=1 Tax=Microbulbifer sp. 2201CG32-9 TaxID=3232309 RepID=UPI00345C21C7